jgi:hypothetical protein
MPKQRHRGKQDAILRKEGCCVSREMRRRLRTGSFATGQVYGSSGVPASVHWKVSPGLGIRGRAAISSRNAAESFEIVACRRPGYDCAASPATICGKSTFRSAFSSA